MTRLYLLLISLALITLLTVSSVNAHPSTYCGHKVSGIATKTVFIQHWNKRYKHVRADGSVWYSTTHKHRYAHGPIVVPPWDHIRVKNCN